MGQPAAWFRWMGLAACFAVIGCSAVPMTRFSFAEVIMGSRAEVTVYAPDEATAIRGVRAAFDRLRSLDAVMSDYRPDSELMLICDQPAGRPVEISDDLARVLARATEISR
ncbi:MAG: FAD:protein FMN transferase, partial [Phycisphaerales bacterium]|nr:FAD:protein FMN transferase [Phycisphaerales bacterium]